MTRFRSLAFFTVCLFFLFTAAPLYAAEATTSGSACSTGLSRVDWDAIFQCASGLWQRAAVMIGASSDTCDSSHAGQMQWNGTSFLLCNGTAWAPLGSGGCSTVGQINTPSGCKTIYVSADQIGFASTPNVYCAYFTNCNTGWVHYSDGDGGRNNYVATDTSGGVSCASRRDDGSCYQSNCGSCYLSYH